MWDWTQTHPAINYPFGRGQGQSAADLPRLLQWPGEKIHLAPSFEPLLSSAIDIHRHLKTLGHLGPLATSLKAVAFGRGVKIREYSRDPEVLVSELKSDPCLLYISNPNPWDSFDYPDEVLRSIVDEARQAGCQILLDDSQAFFSFTETGPGKLDRNHGPISQVEFLGSLKPVLRPHGPDLCYWLSETPSKTGLELSDPASADLACTLQGLAVRTGAATQEFKKRMLEVHYSLRRLTEFLMPLQLKGKVQIPYFPQTGFFLSVDWAPALKSRNWDLATGIRWLESQNEQKVISGDLYGRPTHFCVCFAQPLSGVEKHGPKLAQALDL
jgi:hypothetical protein